jgi:hypothetical protein
MVCDWRREKEILVYADNTERVIGTPGGVGDDYAKRIRPPVRTLGLQRAIHVS